MAQPELTVIGPSAPLEFGQGFDFKALATSADKSHSATWDATNKSGDKGSVTLTWTSKDPPSVSVRDVSDGTMTQDSTDPSIFHWLP